ncbi:uncharacterized protein L969DRAFT_45142 [Mixia osmundae IAM 14324]|uniref:MI domain-containing protein n=1 Tax=Mixia osmundae (strain CBS 9802 / IAM 14324 / JCM 22182 / KY 12970) TaxID=764103 RepID=G7DY57_MIXOS|nr:uncharacterized protein L969DRAFT_45142 [Mixia osmundae IAM 14324]KEI41419.1 hypothetical protein L969DRAFT_45142 [Mixia osmundae IAM 14324]GAA95517.1 hypothetical protein E5Q_02172 [Mixia osmundae IAM 14324]
MGKPAWTKRTTQLPAVLREELEASGKLAPRSGPGAPGSAAHRKAQRKAKRHASKQAAPRPKAPQQLQSYEPREDAPVLEQQVGPSSASSAKARGKRKALDTDTPLERLLQSVSNGDDRPEGASSSSRSGGKSKRLKASNSLEKQEEAEIAWLEAALGRGRSSQAEAEFQEDGLDDLLGDLDALEERLDADEDESPDDASDDENELTDATDDEDEEIEVGEDLLEMGSQDESEPAQEHLIPRAAALGETDTPQPSTSAYVPPALRRAQLPQSVAKPLPDQPVDPRLRRILLGQLNRLSASNFASILTAIESLYASHPRAILTSALIETLLGMITSGGESLGELAVLCWAALVSALNKRMGQEVGAGFIAKSVETLDAHSSESDAAGKTRLNMATFVSHLYNFRVLACPLIYDLIRESIDSGLTEGDVEVLLRIIRVSGQQLRTDDPTALKTIIQLVNDKLKSVPTASMTSRTKFMIETLSNLKNNRLKSSTAGNPILAESETSLRKLVASLSSTRAGASSDPFRFSLRDLRESDTKGKWWLSGAGWKGDQVTDTPAPSAPTVGPVASNGQNATLLKLAKRQGMNTDVRRSIFIVLMSSQDYIDAADGLADLRLTEVQQRETIRVLLHCAGQERRFNPYYALVMAKLLSIESPAAQSYRITLQYCLWDFLRELGESDVGGADIIKAHSVSSSSVEPQRMSNLARSYAWWIAKSGLGLQLLKPLTIQLIRPQTIAFLQQLLVYTCLSTQSSSPLLIKSSFSPVKNVEALEKIFGRTSKTPGLADKLMYFFDKHLKSRKAIETALASSSASDVELALWSLKAAKLVLERSGTSIDDDEPIVEEFD